MTGKDMAEKIEAQRLAREKAAWPGWVPTPPLPPELQVSTTTPAPTTTAPPAPPAVNVDDLMGGPTTFKSS